MQDTIPIIFLPYIFGIFSVLFGIVWNNLHEKIKKLENQICQVPTLQIKVDIADMKNDIAWLKSFLLKQQ
jgi:hypothetical protein